MEKAGQSFEARKALFHKGLKEGRLSFQEIERALPEGSMTASERWLFYYCLRATDVQVVDEETGVVDGGWHVEA